MATSVRNELRRRGLRLEYLTIGWNVVEAFVAVGAGLAAGSIALIGFGFDSVIEVAAASVVVWQFRSEMHDGIDEAREQRALRMIAVTFFVLASYVTFEAVRTLLSQESPDPSTIGILLAAVSVVVMPALGWFKRQTGIRMGSEVLLADAAETFLCAWLSAILLGGLVLNSTLAWWWADPLAALGIAYLAIREGVEACGAANTTIIEIGTSSSGIAPVN